MSRYVALFNRPRDSVTPQVCVCEGISVVVPQHQSLRVLMCRTLVAAGFPDGDIEFRERTRDPLRHSFASIVQHAKLPLYGYIDPVIAASLKCLETNSALWAALDAETQSYLLDREQVVLRGEQPVLTCHGWETLTNWQHVAEGQRAAPPPAPVFDEGTDFTALSSIDVRRVAASIDLMIDGKSTTAIAALLNLIDATIKNKTLDQVKRIGQRTRVTPKSVKGRTSDTKRKRRIIAAVINAGKISWL